MSQGWIRTNRSRPCPCCRATGWCTLSSDGQVCRCMRVSQGAAREGIDKHGQHWWLHKLREALDLSGAIIHRLLPNTPKAPPEVCDRVYRALLASLKLHQGQRRALQERGLGDEQIDRGLYRSHLEGERWRLAGALYERFGQELLTVPGFVRKENSRGGYVTLAGAPGLLIPVRDHEDRIVALKVRRDERQPKYVYLSSTYAGGPGPGSPLHWPVGAAKGPLRITEGELKADVIQAQTGQRTVSLPGVGSWAQAVPFCAQSAQLAFDADLWQNPMVARCLRDLAAALTQQGCTVALEVWESRKGKGLDDLLAGGYKPWLLEGSAVAEHFRWLEISLEE